MLWCSGTNQISDIKNMSTPHLVNIIGFIKSKIDEHNFDDKDRAHFKERIEMVSEELARRRELEPDNIEWIQ